MGVPLFNWDEIRANAAAFSKRWGAAGYAEREEAQTFINEFFGIFGIPRRSVARFEQRAELLYKAHPRSHGRIDLFWPKTLLIEMKSTGENLDDAFEQALNYTLSLPHEDSPAYILVSDFRSFRLYDMRQPAPYEFTLKELYKHVHRFGFITGRQEVTEISPLNPINQKAAAALSTLHEKIKASRYEGHDLEVLLVRLLFCLFAQSTHIFERDSFTKLVEHTREDGRDTGSRILDLFETLDKPTEKRQSSLDDELKSFRYVNGDLFKEKITTVSFNREMRTLLLDCCKLDWAEISPAIFGTLFQSIMDDESRRAKGAHYTSEENILKLINPLFMDKLRAEFEKVKTNKRQLADFHDKLRTLSFLDPACGCGNFLVIAYRELRQLELEAIRIKDQSGQLNLDIRFEVKVDVDQFCGIELEEWPAQVAQVALWITDHQMNLQAEQELGRRFDRIPLKSSPHIKHRNALAMQWETFHQNSLDQFDYILGNPPFIGPKHMDKNQKHDTQAVLGHLRQYGLLDYVCCWFVKVAAYLRNAKHPECTRCAFVSTNSIVQGEQVGILWRYLIDQGIHIHFAHRTFQWGNEAKGKSAVHCVIIGFGLKVPKQSLIFDYATPKSEPHVITATHINPYLVNGPDILLTRRKAPFGKLPKMMFGNQPIDGGHLLLSSKERTEIISQEPNLANYIRQYVGSEEFIWNTQRYCLWLKDAPPSILRLPVIKERLERVRQSRLNSPRLATQKLARTPSLFAFTSHPDTTYLLIPALTSEKRYYIPFGFMERDVIASNRCYIVPSATVYHFGILSSALHMAWIRTVCGRLESRYNYSIAIVYNNFPSPDLGKNQDAIIEASEHVLDIRKKYTLNSLGDLYDSLSMPADLLNAHAKLDREVDKAYGLRGAPSEAERVSFLFNLYEKTINL